MVVARQGASPVEENWQRRRTRETLITAAAALIAQGHKPTLSTVATHSGVSRATAYRYYPTIEMLLLDVTLFATGGALEGLDPSALDGLALPDAAELFVRHLAAWALANETNLRLFLHLSLTPGGGPARPAHRIDWIRSLLAPFREGLHPQTYQHLTNALTLLFGADAIVCLRDIAGLDAQNTTDTLAWAARQLTTLPPQRHIDPPLV